MSKEKKEYPKHIGIILDGNRRWAKERGMLPWDGHKEGAKKWLELKKWMLELDIYELTLYCFSIQNFERDKNEVYFLMKIFAGIFRDLLKDPEIVANEIRIRHIGRIDMLPQSLQDLVHEIENKTKNFKRHVVNFAMAYGGQEEIIDAIKKLFNDKKDDVEKLTPEIFRQYLQLSTYPDLIIRTSGEKRTSNFLVFQQAYSEWFFPKMYWPDFTKKDLVNIIDEYLGKRVRRFGK